MVSFLRLLFLFLFFVLVSTCGSSVCESINCGENGSCNEETGLCDCDEGWTGLQCETYACMLDCGPNGTCNIDLATCDCEPGYFGEQCENFSPCGSSNCGPNGSCNETLGVCECEPGYFGEQCENFSTCGSLDCGPNGSCDEELGICVCELGYIGVDCEIFVPCLVDPTLCGVNMVCDVTVGGCVCVDGWYGENCDSNDPCGEIECNDNQECVNAVCELWCRKFLGAWVQTDYCGIDQYVADVFISATATANELEIVNFAGFSSPPLSFFAEMTGPSTWVIMNQTIDGLTVESISTGSFDLDPSTLDPTLEITYTVNNISCQAVFERP